MPLYEYRCKQCGHIFEKIQSFSAPDEKACPLCGSEVERLISAPAIQFKGSGFYLTDYGKSGSTKGGQSGDGGGGSGDSAAAAKSSGESSKGGESSAPASGSSASSPATGSGNTSTNTNSGSSPAPSKSSTDK